MPKNRINVYRRPSCDVYRRARKTKTKIQKTSMPLVARGFGAGPLLMVVAFVMLSGFYLHTVNANVVRGERVNEIDRAMHELQLAQEELRIEVAQVRAGKHIDDVVARYEMVPVENPTYIDLSPEVALTSR